MIRRTVAMFALIAAVTSLAGCSATETISEPTAEAGPEDSGAPPARTPLEAELDCYLISNDAYSEGRGVTEAAAVAALTGWYPAIGRTTRWGGSSPAAAPWLLFTGDGRGYGTATTTPPARADLEWTATVDTLCVVAVPPRPDEYADLTVEGLTSAEALADPRNDEFRRAMEAAILGLAEGEAADALTAVGWRVRVDERDGVAQFGAGTSSSWINLVIADGTVAGYGVG